MSIKPLIRRPAVDSLPKLTRYGPQIQLIVVDARWSGTGSKLSSSWRSIVVAFCLQQTKPQRLVYEVTYGGSGSSSGLGSREELPR